MEIEPDRFDLLQVPPREVAEQITLLDFEHFRRISAPELSCINGVAWSGKDKHGTAPNVVGFTQRFNRVSFWVVHEILERTLMPARVAMLAFFIDVAKHLNKLNNLHGLLAVLSALRMVPVYRLHKTRSLLKHRSQARYEKLIQFISEDHNHKELRDRMDKLQLKDEACIPALGILQTDLVHMADTEKDPAKLAALERTLVTSILKLQNSQFHLMTSHTVREHMQLFKYSTILQKQMEDEQWKLSCRLEPRAGSRDGWETLDYATQREENHYSMGIRSAMRKLKTGMASLPRSVGKQLGITNPPKEKDAFAKGHRKTRSLGAGFTLSVSSTVSSFWNRGAAPTGEEDDGAPPRSEAAKSPKPKKGVVGKKRSSYDLLGGAPSTAHAVLDANPDGGVGGGGRGGAEEGTAVATGGPVYLSPYVRTHLDSVSDSEMSGMETADASDIESESDTEAERMDRGGSYISGCLEQAFCDSRSSSSSGSVNSRQASAAVVDGTVIRMEGMLHRKANVRGYSQFWVVLDGGGSDDGGAGVSGAAGVGAGKLVLYQRKHSGRADRPAFKNKIARTFSLAGGTLIRNVDIEQPTSTKIHLLLTNGKKLKFKAESRVDRDAWTAALEGVFSNTFSSSNLSPRQFKNYSAPAALMPHIIGAGSGVSVTVIDVEGVAGCPSVDVDDAPECAVSPNPLSGKQGGAAEASPGGTAEGGAAAIAAGSCSSPKCSPAGKKSLFGRSPKSPKTGRKGEPLPSPSPLRKTTGGGTI
jgi:hypothetical protein